MGAREYDADEERLYRLRELPEVPWIGKDAAKVRRDAYEASRRVYRQGHPTAISADPAPREAGPLTPPAFETLRDPGIPAPEDRVRHYIWLHMHCRRGDYVTVRTLDI